MIQKKKKKGWEHFHPKFIVPKIFSPILFL